MVLPFLSRFEENERKNKIISAIITSLIILLFLAICFFWYAMRPTYVSVGEKEIEMVSGIAEGDGGGNTLDYGDRSEGSQNVNNYQPAVANPTPGEMKTPQLAKAEVIQPPATSAADTKSDKPILAGNDETDVTVPQKNDKDKKSNTTTPPVKPSDVKPSEPVKSQPANTGKPSDNSSSGGGSNHGTGPKGAVGNTGTPNTNLLNLDGIEWGSGNGKGGDGGLNNRKVLKMTKPKYDVQEEGRLTYEFIIDPAGNVVFCKALPNRYPNLAKIGEEAIKKEWKFNKLSGVQNQKVVVTITYKLTN